MPHAENISSDARQQSAIVFPYVDLESAVAMARGLYHVGGLACAVQDLASYLQQAVSGGGFRLRLLAARRFGLLQYERGAVQLTELGRRVIDPAQERAARAKAFLEVPLFQAVYEKFQGVALPQSEVLEQVLGSLGVPSKQRGKARQLLLRSARQAGFFNAARDRLTAPPAPQLAPAVMEAAAPQAAHPPCRAPVHSRVVGKAPRASIAMVHRGSLQVAASSCQHLRPDVRGRTWRIFDHRSATE